MHPWWPNTTLAMALDAPPVVCIFRVLPQITVGGEDAKSHWMHLWVDTDDRLKRRKKRNRIVGQLLRWPWQVSLLHFDDLDILL